MPYKLYKILLILAIFAVLVALPAFWLSFKAPTDLEVDFLDVGQGDSILIKTPFGQNILMFCTTIRQLSLRLGLI